MDSPFVLPSIIQNICKGQYFCAAVSSDGKTIALGTDERIALFPVYSPTLPCRVIKYIAKLDSYKEAKCMSFASKGCCYACQSFSKFVLQHANTRKAILHLTFFVGNDDYLIMLGNTFVSIFDLNKNTDEAIVTFCLDSQLVTQGKICFHSINMERHTVATEHTGEVGLSSFDFIINNRKNELNYYKIVFHERERWWYLDCSASVGIMPNIDDRRVPLQMERSYTDVYGNQCNAESVSTMHQMDVEGKDGAQNKKFSISDVGKKGRKASSRNWSRKLHDDASYDSTLRRIPRGRRRSQPDEDESPGNDISHLMEETEETHSRETGSSEETHQRLERKVAAKTPKKRFMTRTATGVKQKGLINYTKILSSEYVVDYNKRRTKNSIDSSIHHGRLRATSSLDAETPVVEWGKLATEDWEWKPFDHNAGGSSAKTEGPNPYDVDLEAELWIAGHQEPLLQQDKGSVYTQFCLLKDSLSSHEVSRKVIMEYPVIDVSDDESLCEYVSLEKTVIVEYKRELLLAVAYRFGYIGFLKIMMPYTILTSTQDGKVLMVNSGEPRTELAFRFQLSLPLNVENIVFNCSKEGYLAVLGGDVTLLLKCFLPDVSYNFSEVKLDNGTIRIASSIAEDEIKLFRLFRHYEVTCNAIYRVGCFGCCSDQWVFVTNSNAGLKVFGTTLDNNRRYLRLSLRCESNVAFADLIWINKTRSALVLMDDGTFAITVPPRKPQWYGLVPNFVRISTNMEYVENEEEFDKKLSYEDTVSEMAIDYHKMEESPDYKFFYKCQYSLFGDNEHVSELKPDCNKDPLIHQDDVIVDYQNRLSLV